MKTLSRVILRCLFAAVLISFPLTRLALAQENPDVFERVLVPVSVSLVPGAFGTLWSTELWYRNNSTRPVIVRPLSTSDSVPTIGITELLRIFLFPAYAPGQFLYLSRDGIDDVQFDLRLFNRADPRSKWGTKIPVVREGEFGDSVNLINVPTATDFRIALRIYGLPDATLVGETVLIKIYSNDDQLLASSEMRFDDPHFPGTPRYAALLSLGDAFPGIRQVDRVRVHVESRSGRSKIWAFVGVTSNTTQDVSIITPH
jgi:hypothetical protein